MTLYLTKRHLKRKKVRRAIDALLAAGITLQIKEPRS
jgi:hypothetical protein